MVEKIIKNTGNKNKEKCCTGGILLKKEKD